MTGHRIPAGQTFDQVLTEQLARARWTRREFLGRVAAFGAATALTQLLVACGQPGATSTAAPATAGPTAVATTAAVATPTPAPTAVPPPEKELYVLNWDGYIGEKTIEKFEEKYKDIPIKVTYDNFVDEAGQISKLTSDGKGGGYDISYPASTWMAQFIADGLVRSIDHSLIPNLKNLSAPWQNPGYDPNNQYSVPNFWWTTGYAWNPKKIAGDLTSWAELWNSKYDQRIYMLDDLRECFAAAAFQLNLSPNTTSTADLDAIVAKLEQQKPLLRDYTTDHVAGFTGGDVDITHCWSGDWVQMIYTEGYEETRYVIPSEGSIKGNDVMIIPSGAPHPIAAHLWIDFNLDGQISAENTNYSGYMGPNDAALPLIDTYITEDPRLNPPAAELAQLIELAYLKPAELDEYTKRWLALKA